MRMPLFDTSAAHRPHLEMMVDACRRILTDGQCILGPEVEAFESELAAFCGMPHAVGVASGTDALFLALRILDPSPGELAVVPSVGFFATAEAALRAGFDVLFADVDPDTGLIDPDSVCVGPPVRVVVGVDLYGRIIPQSVVDLARLRGLTILEDAAQSLGSRRAGHPAGSIGDLAALSFYPTKNLPGAGDAGAILVRDEHVAARLGRLRAHGAASRHHHIEIGGNHRLDALQAALLRVLLPGLDTNARRRAHLGRLWIEGLAGTDFITSSAPHPDLTAWNSVPLLHPRRDAAIAWLARHGMEAVAHYPLPIPLQPALSSRGHRRGEFPGADRFCERVLCVSTRPDLADSDVLHAVEVLRRFDGSWR